MLVISCKNIKCDGCVKKITESLSSFGAVVVDKAAQSVQIDCGAENETKIKTILADLGFLKSGGILGKIKGFFQK